MPPDQFARKLVTYADEKFPGVAERRHIHDYDPTPVQYITSLLDVVYAWSGNSMHP